jgi:two-component system OmpR family sensor kinase
MYSPGHRIMPDVVRNLRRGLFWRVYPTLLVSLVLVAVLGAILWRLLGGPMRPPPGHAAAHFHTHILGMLLSVSAVVGLAAYPVVARITRRLEALRLSVEAWGGGDLDRRAEVDGQDEIAAVAASFNAAADRADALLAAHKAMLAHASHELRSPLTRLGVAVELLAGEAGGDLAPAIRREIAELDALVGEILLASRLDHGLDVDAAETVDCLALAAEEAARASVPLRAAPAEGGPFDVLGSPRLLRRMIRNLLDNALKHGAGPIEVELARGAMASGPSIVIAVRDHGPGIPAELVDRVFEPFFRPGGAAEEAGGWGLGLSLVRQIAERHGGHARCASKGGATVFTAEIPAKS